MLALNYPAFDRLELIEQSVPIPAAGEVRLRVAACGLCGSELETFKTKSVRRTPPLVMGHEFCGVVDAVGEGVTGVALGGRYVSNAVVSCLTCRRCRRGDTHLCASRQVFGMHRPGAFAEMVCVPAAVLIPWPESLPAAAACLAEPLGNGVHVARLTAGFAAEQVMVIGAGPIGLMCQQAMQALRGSRTMVCDVSAGRLAVATRLGAERVVRAGQGDACAAAMAWTEGEGVDLVIDAAGSTVTKQLSLDALRPGGAAVWIGLHGDRMELSSYAVTLPEKHVLGTYAAKQDDLVEAVRLMTEGLVDVTSWVATAPLTEGVDLFQRMLNPGETDLKAVLCPQPTV